MSPDLIAISRDGYSRRFKDPTFGLELAEVVVQRHGLATPLERKVEGSSLVFSAPGGRWLKISPAFFGDAFDAELLVTRHVRDHLPAPVPSIVEAGEIEDWRYLISTAVPGVQIEAVLADLTPSDLTSIAAELGQFMRAFQAVAVPGFERSFGPWSRYLDERLSGVEAFHLSRGNTPDWAAQITGFVEAREAMLRALGPPALIHADLTTEHVMLRPIRGRWRLSGVLDLADSMIAPAALDFIAPFVGLFRGQREAQRVLLAEAGFEPPAEPFPEFFMAVALQHRFMFFHDWFKSEMQDGATRIADIARSVFPD